MTKPVSGQMSLTIFLTERDQKEKYVGVAGAIRVCGAIPIICASNLRNHRDYNWEENKLLPQH